jgi:hypothetical protein
VKVAFHHAAIRAAQYFPEIHREYLRLIRRKGKTIARALIAKELGSIVYQAAGRPRASEPAGSKECVTATARGRSSDAFIRRPAAQKE